MSDLLLFLQKYRKNKYDGNKEKLDYEIWGDENTGGIEND